MSVFAQFLMSFLWFVVFLCFSLFALVLLVEGLSIAFLQAMCKMQ